MFARRVRCFSRCRRPGRAFGQPSRSEGDFALALAGSLSRSWIRGDSCDRGRFLTADALGFRARRLIVMKLRLVLSFLSVFLSLSLSADRTFTNCPQAWFSIANSETLEQGLGVNIHFTDPQPGEMKMIADAGFRWVRMDFVWADTERAPGRYDFSAYDRLMQSLDQFRLHALFILDYRNVLYDNGAPPRSERAIQAFATWAVAAAKHFAGRGIIWETYN